MLVVIRVLFMKGSFNITFRCLNFLLLLLDFCMIGGWCKVGNSKNGNLSPMHQCWGYPTKCKYVSVPCHLGLLSHLRSMPLEGNPLRQLRRDIVQRGTQQLLRHLREKLPNPASSYPGQCYCCKCVNSRFAVCKAANCWTLCKIINYDIFAWLE